MAQEIALDITINSLEASKSLAELKKGIKDATNALAGFEEGSAEFNKLSAAIGQAKDQVQDINEAVTLSSQGGFGAIADIGSKIAAGFSVAQSAMALFGSESKELEETLMKVQAAMALAQGAKELSELSKSFNNLKTVATGVFKSIQASITSTGIGALVVALGVAVAAIVTYWDDIKEAITGVNEEQKKLNEESKKAFELEQKKLQSIKNTENILKLQGKTEREILNLKIEQIKKDIEKGKVALINAENDLKNVKASEQKWSDFAKFYVKVVGEAVLIPWRAAAGVIDLMILSWNGLAKALGKDSLVLSTINGQITDLKNKAAEKVASFIFDPEKVQEDGEKAIQAQKDVLQNLENEMAGYQLQIQEMDKKTTDKKIDNSKKEAKEKKDIATDLLNTLANIDEQDRLDAIKRLENKRKDWELSGRLTYERQKEILKDIYELEILNQKLTDEEKKALKLKLDEDLKKIDDQKLADNINKWKKEREEIAKDYDQRIAQQEKFLDEQKRKKQNTDDDELILAKLQYDKILAITKEGDAQRIKAQEDYDAKVAEIDARDRARKEAAVMGSLNVTKDGLKATADLVAAFAGQSEAQQKKAFEIQKGINIATATIDTFQSAVAAYKGSIGIPIVGPVLAPIAAAVAIAAGIANIRKIEQTTFNSKSTPSASGGGASGGMFAPNLNAPVGNTSTNLSSIGFGGQESEPVKVFVTETDISSTQNKVQKIEQKASIE